MATSPRYRAGEQAPQINKGHGTVAVGPGDTSDSGSDMQGDRSAALDDVSAEDLDAGSDAAIEAIDEEIDVVLDEFGDVVVADEDFAARENVEDLGDEPRTGARGRRRLHRAQ